MTLSRRCARRARFAARLGRIASVARPALVTAREADPTLTRRARTLAVALPGPGALKRTTIRPRRSRDVDVPWLDAFRRELEEERLAALELLARADLALAAVR